MAFTVLANQKLQSFNQMLDADEATDGLNFFYKLPSVGNCWHLCASQKLQSFNKKLEGWARLECVGLNVYAIVIRRELLAVLSTVPDCPHVWCDFNLLGDPR